MVTITQGVLPLQDAKAPDDARAVVRLQSTQTVSEAVIGRKKVLCSARTARMKLVKNDTGTRTNGVWTLSYLFSRWLRTLLAQRSIGFPPLRCGLRFAQTRCGRERRSKGHEWRTNQFRCSVHAKRTPTCSRPQLNSRPGCATHDTSSTQ